MTAYYNEIDGEAAHVMRALIADGVIAPGDVDTRSITEVQPDDLRSYTQCHFFAGGGLWSVAARMAGWADDRPLWTGSCPCQPFSVAGKGGGVDDVRHLWPDFFRLVSARRPPVVVGEQVAGKAGYGWLDGVRADLAREGYAGRGVDIPACAVDAPHIRQRLYWVALADAEGNERGAGLREGGAQRDRAFAANGDGSAIVLGNSEGERRGEGWSEPELRSGRPALAGADASGVTQGDAFGSRLERQRGHGDGATGWAIENRPTAAAVGGERSGDLDDAERERLHGRLGPIGAAGTARASEGEGLQWERVRPDNRESDGFGRRNGSWWADHEWLACHDQKARRTQPGTPLLVDGLPGRVGLWRLAGNAISPVLAAEVLGALMDVLPHPQGAK